jgi:hypothetical protein
MLNMLKRLMTTLAEDPDDDTFAVSYPAGRGRRRGFPRHRVQIPAVVRAGRRTVEGLSGTMGMGGLFLQCANPLPPHTPVTVELELPQIGLPTIQAKGSVAYALAEGMGIRFTGLTQADCRQLRDLFVQARTAANPAT